MLKTWKKPSRHTSRDGGSMETFFDPFLVKVWEMEEKFDVTFSVVDLETISQKKLVERFLLSIAVDKEEVRVVTDVEYILEQHRHVGEKEIVSQAYEDVQNSPRCYVWECTESRMIKILELEALLEVFCIWDDNYLFSSKGDKRRYV